MRLFQLAALPAREADSKRMLAYLHLQDAEVYARRGNAKATKDSIRRAHETHAERDSEQAQPAHFLSDMHLHHSVGLAYSELAGHHPAAASLALESQAVALQHAYPNETRTLLMRRIDLALNAYRSGDTDLANETTGAIVAALPQVSSRRLTARLRPLAAEAATHDSTAADLAHGLRHQIHTATSRPALPAGNAQVRHRRRADHSGVDLRDPELLAHAAGTISGPLPLLRG